MSKAPDMAPALSVGIRYPHTASRWRPALPAKPARQQPCQPSVVTLIDLPCTPKVPGIHLPWTCAATGRAPATTPMHPILPKIVRCPRTHLCTAVHNLP